MFCPNCGKETVNDAAVFCMQCGSKFIQGEQSVNSPNTQTSDIGDNAIPQIPIHETQTRTMHNLPGGYIPIAGEEIITDDEYIFSISQFWLKSRIALTTRSVIWQTPNLILGFIPVGRKTGNQPLAQITTVTTNRKFSLAKGIVGLLFFLGGLGFLSDGGPLGIIIGLIGLSLLLSTIHTTFEMNHLGGPTGLTASVTQTSRLETLSNRVSQAIANVRR